MVVETSAVIAILRREGACEKLLGALEKDPVRLICSVSVLEASMVVESRLGPQAGAHLELLIYRLGLEMVPFDQTHVELAKDAFRRFGKGRHRAALNFGDCAAYALARASGEPLLFVGEDLSRTDIGAAVSTSE